MKKKLIIIIVFLIFLIPFTLKPTIANAETLNENIDNQLNNIDFSALEEYLKSLNEDEKLIFTDNFVYEIKNILNGKSSISINGLLSLFTNSITNSFRSLLPHFIVILAISILCAVISTNAGGFLSQSIKDVIYYVSVISVVIIISLDFGSLLKNTENAINKLTNLSEIMLPIIISLMIASGGNVSVNLYKPAVVFLTNGITNIYLTVLLPLIGITVIFAILSNISSEIKITKMKDFISGIIKWIIGISITIFSFFMTVQGLTASNIDGISFRAIKYAISNSVPLLGPFLGGGFDIVVAGAVLIKNAVGVGAILLMFSILFSPLVMLIVYSLLLKLFAAVSEPLGDSKISNLLTSISKSVSLLIGLVLAISLMFFISMILLIVSASSFI